MQTSPVSKSAGGIHQNTPAWERFYVAIPREIAVKFYTTPAKSENLNGSVTQKTETDARPSRDGSEQFGSGTQAHGQI